MKISIIGAGWVGTAVGRGLTDLGNEVIFHDIIDKDLPNFTKDINYAVENSDVSFICVPTPTNDNDEIDLSYVKEASKNIGEALANKNGYHLVVVKSTVVPETTEKVVNTFINIKGKEKKLGGEMKKDERKSEKVK